MPSKRNKKKQPTHQTPQLGIEQNVRDAQALIRPHIRRWLVLLSSGALGASLLILVWTWVVPPTIAPTDSGQSDGNTNRSDTIQSNAAQSNPLPTLQNPQTASSADSVRLKLPTTNDRLTAEQLQAALQAVAESLAKEFPNDAKAHHVAAMIYAELRQT